MAGKVREKAKRDGPRPVSSIKTVILQFLHRTLPSMKIRKESDLYRPPAIPVVWHRCYPAPVQLSLVRSEKLYSVCWILQFGLEEFRIHFNVLIK